MIRMAVILLVTIAASQILGGWLLYSANLELERHRLRSSAQRQARLIESFLGRSAGHGAKNSAAAETLRQMVATGIFAAFGDQGETSVIGQIQGASLQLLLRDNQWHARAPLSIPTDSPLARAMLLALKGRSGTELWPGEQGMTVLAAYEPVKGAGLGLVLQGGLAPLRESYRHALGLSGGLALLLALAAIGLMAWMQPPRRQRQEDQTVNPGLPLQPAPTGRGIFDRRKSEGRQWEDAQIIDQLNAAVIVMDAAGRVLFWNQGAETMYGYSAAEMMGEPLDRLYPESDVPLADHAAMQMRPLLEKGTHRVEVQRRHKSGRLFAISLSLSLIRDAAGKPGWIVGTAQDISQQKKIEGDLRKNQHLLQCVFDTIPHRLFVKDTKSNYLMVNQAFADQYGAQPEDWIGKNTTTIPEFSAGEYRLFSQTDAVVFSTGKTMENQYVQVEAPAEPSRYIHLIKTPLRDEHGEVIGLIGLGVDITQIKHSEAELRASQRLLQAVFDNAPIGINVKDRQGKFLMANAFMGEMFDLNTTEMLGKTLEDLKIADRFQNNGVKEDELRVLETGDTIDREQIRFLNAKGEVRWCRLIKTPLIDDTQGIIGVVSVSADITKQVRFEQAMMDSWTTLQLAQEISRIGILDWDIESGEMKWSDNLYQILGYAPQQFAPTFETYLQCAHPEDRSFLADTLKQSLQEQGEYAFQHRFIRPDHQEGHLQGKGRVFYDGHGAPTRMLGVIEDISRNMAALSDLESQSSKLLQSNRALEEFAMVAAHDLQEPLRKISLFGERLKSQAWERLSEGSQFHVDRICGTAGRMRDLVEGLLSYSRINSKEKEVVLLNLQDVVGEVLSDLEVKIEGSGARIVLGDFPRIKGDLIQMRQLFQNLISNALKFQREGEKPLILVYQSEVEPDVFGELDLVRIKDYCQINVKDNGIGFDPKYRDRIFKIFQRLNHMDKYQGVGIGLSLCQKIVEQHGGKITAEGELGKGSIFKFLLPYQPSQYNFGLF